MQPLKITAIMQDGRVAGTEPWFPLDGILAAAWMRKQHPEVMYLPITDYNNIIVADLPFEKRGSGDNWYWACSFNTAKPLGEYIMHWHKRFDDDLEQYIDFAGKRGRIDTKSGKYKSYRMPLVVQLFDRLEWYAFGDQQMVLELCQTITHIGKKSSQGLGAVDYWTVESWPDDWSECRDGAVSRAIPAEYGLPAGVEEANIVQCGLRPPYWLYTNKHVCYMPASK